MEFYKRKEIYRGDDKLYLIRYSLFSCKWFAVKVHHILLSDDDCQHDHPWSFLSLILWGGYREHRTYYMPHYDKIGLRILYEVHGDQIVMFRSDKYFKPGSVIYRKATDVHKLELSKPAWTLVITFKKVREWGFWKPDGWVHWFKFRSTGSKCE